MISNINKRPTRFQLITITTLTMVMMSVMLTTMKMIRLCRFGNEWKGIKISLDRLKHACTVISCLGASVFCSVDSFNFVTC